MTKAQKKNILDYTTKYKIDLVFSVEDDCYVANIPELPGCMTHGFFHSDFLGVCGRSWN